MLEKVVDPNLTVSYYILVVVFGALFIVNLFLAVIFEAFLKSRGDEDEAGETTTSKKQDISFWEWVVYGLITANTVTMCLEYNGMSAFETEVLEMFNLVFTFAFAAEMIFKLMSQGVHGYFQGGWNTFDFLVTNASIIDLFLDMWGHDTEFLRALRVARVLRLLRLNSNMQRFEATFAMVAVPMVNMSGVLCLIMVVFSMLGMELFGGKLGGPLSPELGDTPPRTNFDYFSNAFITTFIVTSGENWNDVFADTLMLGNPWVSVAFFVPLFIMGNYVLVNLFVAIICWGWDTAAPDRDDGGPSTKEEQLQVDMYKAHLQVRHRISSRSPNQILSRSSAALALTLPWRACVSCVFLPPLSRHPQKNRTLLNQMHAELMVEIQEMIRSRELGFSETFGRRLMADMATHMKAFNSAIDEAVQQRADELEMLAGTTMGFASLIWGLCQLLDDRGQGTQHSPQIELLCEYWDSEHARITGSTGAANTRTSLHNALKKYITTITANKQLMMAVAETRHDMRERRGKRGNLRTVPCIALKWKDVGYDAEREGPVITNAKLADHLRNNKVQFNPIEFEKFEIGKGGVDPMQMPAVRYNSYILVGNTHFQPVGDDELGCDHLPLKPDTLQAGACIRQLRAIVNHGNFTNFIMFCIVCSSAALAFDMPDVLPGSPTANTLELLDYLFTTIFVVEMVLKLIAYGAFTAPDGYFLDGWNILDGFIVFTSVISLVASGVEGLSVFRSMRAVRTLRPLRVIQRNPGLKQVVNSFLRALPGMWSVTIVCGLVFLAYGRFLMQFLSGRMGSCNDLDVLHIEQCVGTFMNADGVETPRWWGNDDIGNFDNIAYAVLTLFEMATLEMWPDLLFRAMDTDPSAKGAALTAGLNPIMAVYIILWIVISAFFLLNLFVGVVLENFDAIRKAEDGSAMMSDSQKEWASTVKNVLATNPEMALRAPGGKSGFARFRRRVFMLVQGSSQNEADPEKRIPVAFEKFIISLVLFNVLSMALTWHGQPGFMYKFAETADIFFTVAFTLEMLLKITALGLRQYLHSWWNRFDAILVNGALIADVLQSLEAIGITIDPATLRLLRIFRILRLLRLMKVSRNLNRLIMTIFKSLPALINVGVLLFLFMYIYNILGIELFHNLPQNGEYINEDANFANFATGFMTLFRCVTGESYNGLMHDAMVTESGSAPGRCSDAEGNCGSPIAAVSFFVSFFIIESLVMLNLIVAVVLDAFAEEEKAGDMKLTAEGILQFQTAWQELDRDANMYVETKSLRKLLFLLDMPHGFANYKDLPKILDKDGNNTGGGGGQDPTPKQVTERMNALAIPDRQGKGMAYFDVLEAIARHACKDLGEIELPVGSAAEKELRQKYSDVFKSTGMHNTEVSQYSSAYIFNVIRMQAAFRRRRANQARSVQQAKTAKEAAVAARAAAVESGTPLPPRSSSPPPQQASSGSPPGQPAGNGFVGRARGKLGGSQVGPGNQSSQRGGISLRSSAPQKKGRR